MCVFTPFLRSSFFFSSILKTPPSPRPEPSPAFPSPGLTEGTDLKLKWWGLMGMVGIFLGVGHRPLGTVGDAETPGKTGAPQQRDPHRHCRLPGGVPPEPIPWPRPTVVEEHGAAVRGARGVDPARSPIAAWHGVVPDGPPRPLPAPPVGGDGPPRRHGPHLRLLWGRSGHPPAHPGGRKAEPPCPGA